MDYRPIVEALLAEFGVGTTWRALSEADSFTILSFVIELEKRGGVALSPAELVPNNFASVELILEMIGRTVAA
jgi:acyl carrier protein